MAIRQFFTSTNFERNSSLFYTNCRSLGSSLSLNQSPRKLSDITVISIATPGTTVIHQATLIYPRPSATIAPHVGVGGGTPAPTKLKNDSARISPPVDMVAITITVLDTPGNMCTIKILVVDAPATLANAT